ncbi:MAG: PepSY domain-containing protein [Actinomyces sp.]|nr:PepSY domain-containing protein [Actinomyces sp.]
MKTTRKLAFVPAIALAFTLGACSSQNDPAPVESEPTSTTTTSEATQSSLDDDRDDDADDTAESGDDDQASAASGVSSNEQALAAVAAAEGVNGGRAYSLETNDQRSEWKVKVVEGNEGRVYVIDQSGNVVRNEIDDDFDEDDKHVTDAGIISLADAVKAALAERPDGYLESADFDDNDDNKFYFEVELENEAGGDLAEFDIDAESGAVTVEG